MYMCMYMYVYIVCVCVHVYMYMSEPIVGLEEHILIVRVHVLHPMYMYVHVHVQCTCTCIFTIVHVCFSSLFQLALFIHKVQKSLRESMNWLTPIYRNCSPG